ncbi:OmpP1/FadL family transporter [Tenacibaculum finnmarkense]|uniref:OmpP1/FadL family transporter n=1 Tax=Tenacibaculum finnmarkense TaxID=2781243 RepID=UPI001E525DEE|nr:hemin receptor [Tenacibaculum finnmarkense]MCD8410218.1 hemin receptor [Tenacibaculum finnmarkense genomovar ulcerans]MCG8762770.1 hemin receptor [Tenacibaculum finnmarkense]MCG8788147.1 hemin receptor [Tenacibaculum finnmarkense]
MKRILTFAILIASTYTGFSQSLNYNELGTLFSGDDTNGTARFEAMSGAFGALGGDVSAIGINPAGAVVSRKSVVSATLSNRNTAYSSMYYGNKANTENTEFNLSQAGAILAFNTAYNSNWNRFALSVNYRIKKDFNSAYNAQGNSGDAYFTEHLTDPSIIFDYPQEQFIENETTGKSSVYSFGFSAVHLNKLSVGATLNFHKINFTQLIKINEFNNDTQGNTLDAFNVQDSSFDSNGFSLNLGFIYKFNQNLRLGLAFETPTWYHEVYENSNLVPYDEDDFVYQNYKGYFDLTTPNINNGERLESDNPFQENVYRFKTPSRITASGAYIFGKKGLISIDYTYKNYKNIKLSDGNFSVENANFTNNYRNTHALNIGTEWRFDNISVRGGYRYEKNPNLILGGNTNKDNLSGFSTGLGYNFGNTKIDLAYSKQQIKQFYTIYNTGDLTTDNKTSKISATLTFNL